MTRKLKYKNSEIAGKLNRRLKIWILINFLDQEIHRCTIRRRNRIVILKVYLQTRQKSLPQCKKRRGPGLAAPSPIIASFAQWIHGPFYRAKIDNVDRGKSVSVVQAHLANPKRRLNIDRQEHRERVSRVPFLRFSSFSRLRQLASVHLVVFYKFHGSLRLFLW